MANKTKINFTPDAIVWGSPPPAPTRKSTMASRMKDALEARRGEWGVLARSDNRQRLDVHASKLRKLGAEATTRRLDDDTFALYGRVA